MRSGLRLRTLSLVLALASCGGGSNAPSAVPSAPPPPPAPPAGIAITIVDGSGRTIDGAAVTIDDAARTPRSPGIFEIEPALIGHPLQIAKDGFLLHQDVVPDHERRIDLFEVPADSDKVWLQNLLYDGVINRSGLLARLLRPVSILRGNTISPELWAQVRDVWQQAADRMSSVTGYPFRLADQSVPGSAPFTVDLAPRLGYGGYLEWSGGGNQIMSAEVQFRTSANLGNFSLILHELTHGFGLSHSDRTTDVMHPSAVCDVHSERELLVVAAVKRRPAGTAFEDNVRSPTSTLSGRISRAYSCGLP